MASERDREIWDDATNAVCQAMQEQKMCNCPDGDCLAAKIDFSPEKIATATRPAPAATDTGLETLSVELTPSGHPYMKSDQEGDYVTRSQAEELLAAERAENTRLQSENDAQADQISELQMTPWPEWATKVLAVIRKRSGYDGYGDAIEGVDLPAELDECIAAIEADNAALTARVKELSALIDGENCADPDKIDALFRRAETAETQLAARNKAFTDIQCIDWDGLSVSDVFDEINEIVERAALEVKP